MKMPWEYPLAAVRLSGLFALDHEILCRLADGWFR